MHRVSLRSFRRVHDGKTQHVPESVGSGCNGTVQCERDKVDGPDVLREVVSYLGGPGRSNVTLVSTFHKHIFCMYAQRTTVTSVLYRDGHHHNFVRSLPLDFSRRLATRRRPRRRKSKREASDSPPHQANLGIITKGVSGSGQDNRKDNRVE